MTESATSRTARALDLIPFLLENQGISISELAAEFAVSELQILDDLNLLFICGLPGYSPLELIDMNFEDGYVTVSDPQVLDKPRKLTHRELTTLLVSLEVMKSLGSTKVKEELSTLQEKLGAVMPIKATFEVVIDELAQAKIDELSDAIAKGSGLNIRYLSAHSDQDSWRQISPTRIFVDGKHTYIEAWCRTSGGERVFRLDRILELTGDQSFLTSKDFLAAKKGSVDVVSLIISNRARIFREENSQLILESKVVENGVAVFLSPIDQQWLARSIAGFGAEIVVLGPPSLQEAVTNHKSAIRLRYE